MQRFFISGREIEQNELVITGDNARHISYSLRMAPGELIAVCDGAGNDCICEITSITRDAVYARVTERKRCEAEPPYRAVLYQSLAKGEKMDLIVQKATEFGVSEIVPVESARCIARIREGGAEKKIARWSRIAEEAAKQCGRGVIPVIADPMSFADAVERASGSPGCSFICYENERTRSVRDLARSAEYSFFIGPEGGYEESEAAAAASAGIVPVTLGRRILRCESASGFVLACLSCLNEL